MNKIINGNEIKDEIIKKYQNIINEIEDTLKLVVIEVGNDPASEIYVKNKQKLCEIVGIDFKLLKYDYIEETDLIKEIERLNNDKTVTGILVQLPLPDYLDKNRIINTIDPLKDVDGLSDVNVLKLNNNENGLVPCTALGIMEILKYLNVDLKKKNVVVMGRSALVGSPVSKLLKNEGANVTVCHSKTEDIKSITSKADVLVVAIGKKQLVDSSYIKDGVIVIDVGINRDNNKLYGDCNFEDIVDKCKYITPVPKGVGPLTVAMLIGNVIKAYKLKNDK